MKMPLSILLVTGVLVAGCQATTTGTRGEVDKKLTVGVVQRELEVGMSSAAVVEALGSPNIVTTDDSGCEVWVYDRFAEEVRAQRNGFFLVFFYGDTHREDRTTRTLTVVVKFDKDRRVRELAYHATSS